MLVMGPPGLDSGLLGPFWGSSGAAVWGAEPAKTQAKYWFWCFLNGLNPKQNVGSGASWAGFLGSLGSYWGVQGWILASWGPPPGLLGWILACRGSWAAFWPGNALKGLSGGFLEQFSGLGCEMLVLGPFHAKLLSGGPFLHPKVT